MSQDVASPVLSPSVPEPTTRTLPTEDEYEQLKRFQIELEFVQCLSNPWYLHHLAQQQYFNQDAFIQYLNYLQYFRKPEYAKYIIYPHCLHFLTLLQHKSFRDHLAKQDTATFVHERQYYHWQYLRNQDKVVRMEIMPDGSLVEIKHEVVEPASVQPQIQIQAEGQVPGLGQGDVAVAPAAGSTPGQQGSRATVTGAAGSTPGAGIDVPNGAISLLS